MFLVASLRNEELCLVQLPLHIERNDDFLGLAIEAFAYFGDSRQQQFAVGFVEFSLVFEGETLVYAAVLHVYVIDKSRTVVLVVDNREHVDVGNSVADNLAFGAETFYKHVFLLQLFSFFKLQFRSFLLHLLENVLRQFARVSFQYLACLSYRCLIIL